MLLPLNAAKILLSRSPPPALHVYSQRFLLKEARAGDYTSPRNVEGFSPLRAGKAVGESEAAAAAGTKGGSG